MIFQLRGVRFTYPSGTEPVGNVWKGEVVQGDWSHLESASHISSLPVECVGNGTGLPISQMGFSLKARC